MLISSTWFDAIIYSFNPGQLQLSAVVLNAKSYQPQISIIISNDSEYDTGGLQDNTIDAHIKKPFALEDLQDLVDQTIHCGKMSVPVWAS